MNDFGMELYAGGDCFNRVLSRILLFYYGEVIRCPFVYFYFFSGAVYIFESVEIQFNRCHLPKSSCVIFLSPSKSNGSSPDMGNKKRRNHSFFILFYLNSKWKGLPTFFGHSRSFAAAFMGGELAISRFPQLRMEESWQLQLYRCSHRR